MSGWSLTQLLAGLHDDIEQRLSTARKTAAAGCLQQTESLFAENHETFFNAIDPYRPFAA